MVPKVGKAYWMLRYTLFKKRKEVTIGKVDELSLADARLKAAECSFGRINTPSHQSFWSRCLRS